MIRAACFIFIDHHFIWSGGVEAQGKIAGAESRAQDDIAKEWEWEWERKDAVAEIADAISRYVAFRLVFQQHPSRADRTIYSCH
ncbi:MAG: hypothetical protein DMG80_10265 [Acidobacteria bacterium]|nr:MAG: hypothetical protein DMG80_10265 [Acidobacteriota bacterium]